MKRFVVLDLVVTLSYRVEQRGAAASGEEKKNRDAVTSFYVYNRLCVWRVLYNTAINLCLSLSLPRVQSIKVGEHTERPS